MHTTPNQQQIIYFRHFNFMINAPYKNVQTAQVINTLNGEVALNLPMKVILP